MRHRHWWRVGSRAAARSHTNRGLSGTVSSSLLFPARGNFHRDLQSQANQHKQSILCFFCRSVFFCFPFRSADLESVLVHAPPTGKAYGWLDQRFLLSSFISTPTMSPTTTMVGRSAPLKSLFFAPPLRPFLAVFRVDFMETSEQGG